MAKSKSRKAPAKSKAAPKPVSKVVKVKMPKTSAKPLRGGRHTARTLLGHDPRAGMTKESMDRNYGRSAGASGRPFRTYSEPGTVGGKTTKHKLKSGKRKKK